MDESQIGKRAWSYAGVLQDAGLSCFEYVEQLTLLLFLKMADQLTQPPYGKPAVIPATLGWKALLPLNPAQGLIANFRAAALNGPLDWYALGVSSLVSVVLFVVGCLYFHRVERGFADII